MKQTLWQTVRQLLAAQVKTVFFGLMVGALLLGACSLWLIPERYTSSALLYVTKAPESLTDPVRLSDTLRTAVMVDTHLVAVTVQLESRVTKDDLISHTELIPVPNTTFLQIRYTGSDPVLTLDACRAMSEKIAAVYGLLGENGTAVLYQPAETAENHSLPTTLMFILGGVLGCVLTALALILRELLDDTIRGKDDLASHLDVPVLGEIPALDPTAKGGRRHG